jgi:SAM-dependent methyltransferase
LDNQGGLFSAPMKSVLNVGGGSKAIALPPHYHGWQHVLLDVDPKGNPDIVLDARALHTLPPVTYDAVFCSHNLEHYHRHHGADVLRGMNHVLKADGFLEIQVPDVGEVMRLAVQNRLDLDDILYDSPRGPILLRDVLWGYHVEIEQSGRDYYAHKTGFTPKSLVNFIIPLGFPFYAIRQENLEITAIFFKQHPSEDQQRLLGFRYQS